MEKDSALQILNSRKLISVPGKYTLKVTSATPFIREDNTVVNITNYAAMTPYQLQQARELFKAGDYQKATNQALSSSQRIANDYLPAKGEHVEVLVDEIVNKEGITILAVVSVTAIKTSKAGNVSFEEVEETVAAAEEAPLV
jgi:hypothetical protein